MHKFCLIFLLIFCQNLYLSQSIKGFHVPDSLKSKSFKQLESAYNKVFRIDNNKAELYANTILTKGKKENNNDQIYDGYYKIAHIKGLESRNGYPYSDTLLTITRNVNTKEYPAKAYIIRGILLNYEFKYKEALNNYIEAQNLSRNKNLDQFYYIKKLIGILKTATDENEEALPLFLEYYTYQKQKVNTDDKEIKSYIGSIFSVSNAYNKIKDYKRCKFYNNIGIEECRKYNDYTHYPYFIMSEGITDYYLKNYNAASENLLKIEGNLLKNRDAGNLSILYYYLGKINYDRKKEKEAIHFLIKSDSLSFASNDFIPITRDRYEILIDYYKNKEDNKSQLKFINKLFYADSVMNNSRQYLSKEIYKKYDTPILLEQKEKLIADLDKKNFLLYWVLGIGLVIICILIYIYTKNKKKIKEYQKQAEVLLKKSKDHAAEVSKNIVTKQHTVKEEKTKSMLSDEKLQHIKLQLEKFENNNGFLRKNITVDILAKDFNTNRDYISKSVNELKEKNFSQYINELRINYIIEELNQNEKLRKFTISAIADEAGYNNSESFSNAFKKITNTLPSYYIKLLQK